MKLAPADAEYHALLAEHLEGFGSDPVPAFLAAASLSPDDARYWIRLGFNAEARGDYESAEKYLIRAAAVNRKFDPAWALMNFYFRRGAAPKFWKWADKAMAMSYGDRSPMFRLFWDESQDATFIQSHIPNTAGVLSSYLSFLEANGHFEAAFPIAVGVASICADSCVPQLQVYCEQEWIRDPRHAMNVWNILCNRHLLPFTAVDPEKGVLLGDPGFAAIRGGVGFGWHVYSPDEITVVAGEPEKTVEVGFRGNEAEDCLILEQLLPPLEPHRVYTFSYSAVFSPGSVVEGLLWDVVSASGLRSVAISEISSSRPGRQVLKFAAADETPVRLRLEYRRPTGAVRARGAVTLSSLQTGIAR